MKSCKNLTRALGPTTIRWDLVLVLFLTPAVLLFTSLVLNGFVDPYDEGLHFLSYPLFKAGKVPYVDFYPLFPPIWTYANIIIEFIFGEYLLVQRLWFVLQACFVVWACYALCTRIYSKGLLPIGVTALIIIFGFHPFWLPRWSGARLAVYIAILLYYMRHVKKGDDGAKTRLFTLGVLTGLTNLYALDVGIHITAAGAAMVIIIFLGTKHVSLKKNVSRLALCIAGFLLPLILWAAYLAYHGSLTGYISTYYYVYMFQLMPISTEILSGSSLYFGNLRLIVLFIFLLSLAAGLLYGLIYKGFIKKELYGEWRVLMMAMLLSFAVSISTLRGLSGPQYPMFSLIPMLLWGGLGVHKLTSYLHKRNADEEGQGINPPKTMLAGLIMFSILALVAYLLTANDTKGKIATMGGNLTIAVQLFHGDKSLNAYSSEAPGLAYISDGSLIKLIKYLRSHTGPDEAILAFPMYTEIIPSLAGRHSATRYPIPILLMGSPDGQLEYIKDIEREKPRYAVLLPSAKFGGRRRIKPYFRPIYRYLKRHYRLAEDFRHGEAQQIWVRKDR